MNSPLFQLSEESRKGLQEMAKRFREYYSEDPESIPMRLKHISETAEAYFDELLAAVAAQDASMDYMMAAINDYVAIRDSADRILRFLAGDLAVYDYLCAEEEEEEDAPL